MKFEEFVQDFLQGFFAFFKGPIKISAATLSESLEKEAFLVYDFSSYFGTQEKLLLEFREVQEHLALLHKTLLRSTNSLRSQVLVNDTVEISLNSQEDNSSTLSSSSSSSSEKELSSSKNDFLQFVEKFDQILRYSGSVLKDASLKKGETLHPFKARFMTLKTQVETLLSSLSLLDHSLFSSEEHIDLESRLLKVRQIVGSLLSQLGDNALEPYKDLFGEITLFLQHLESAKESKSLTGTLFSRLELLRNQKQVKEEELLELESSNTDHLSVSLKVSDETKALEKIEDDVFLFLVRLKEVLVALADLNSDYDFLAFTHQIEEFSSRSSSFLDEAVLAEVGPKLQEIMERIEYGILFDVEGMKFSFEDLFVQWDQGHVHNLLSEYLSLQKADGLAVSKLPSAFESKLLDLRYRVDHYTSQEKVLLKKYEDSRQQEGKYIDQALVIKQYLEEEWKKRFDKDIEIVVFDM